MFLYPLIAEIGYIQITLTLADIRIQFSNRWTSLVANIENSTAQEICIELHDYKQLYFRSING